MQYLVLNRPERKNALDRALVQALGLALRETGRDPEVRVIVLSGAGGAFCSGADLRSMTGKESSELEPRLDEFHELIRAIVGAPQPVIAQIEGPAVGFGADLALACDLRLFADTGYLEEGFVKIGLMPDGGGTMWLARQIGYVRAFEMLTLGTRLSAEDCLRLNIANSVVTAANLPTTIRTLAQRLADAAPLAVVRIKRALRQADEALLEQTLALEKEGQLALLKSRDFQEGVAAFLEKRAPQFRGS